MATSQKNLGKVVGQVQGYRIRQISKTSQVKGKTVTTGGHMAIFKGKTMVESGFKTKESAITRVKQMIG